MSCIYFSKVSFSLLKDREEEKGSPQKCIIKPQDIARQLFWTLQSYPVCTFFPTPRDLLLAASRTEGPIGNPGRTLFLLEKVEVKENAHLKNSSSNNLAAKCEVQAFLELNWSTLKLMQAFGWQEEKSRSCSKIDALWITSIDMWLERSRSGHYQHLDSKISA